MSKNMANWQDRIVSFSRKPAHEFLANPQNARRHPARQREALRGSLDTIGWASPVIVSAKSGFMLDGHARVEEALSKDENALIPVIEVDLEEHEEKLFLVSFDYITYMAEYDRDSLDSLLQDVQTDDARLQAMLSELAESNDLYFGDTPVIEAAPEAQIDRAEELNKVWGVKSGDLWIIPSKTGSGVHRLLCGDSTKAEDVGRLMGDDCAELCFTSPPYSDQRDYSGNDVSVETLKHFISSAKPFVRYFAVNLGIKRVDYAIFEYWQEYIQHAKSCGLKLLSWNVWDKVDAGAIGNQVAMFAICHEWIFVFGESPKQLNRIIPNENTEATKRKASQNTTRKRNADGSTVNTSYGEMKSHRQLYTVSTAYGNKDPIRELHPATMPIDIVLDYVESMTDINGSIYDPFGGSGTTMVACEQLSRQCRMIEISENYCAVILQRMTDMGLSPYLETQQ